MVFQWVRALATHLEVLCSTPRNGMAVQNICNSSLKGSESLFWLPEEPGAHVFHRHTHRQNQTFSYIISAFPQSSYIWGTVWGSFFKNLPSDSQWFVRNFRGSNKTCSSKHAIDPKDQGVFCETLSPKNIRCYIHCLINMTV